jgi:hypothetical protein
LRWVKLGFCIATLKMKTHGLKAGEIVGLFLYFCMTCFKGNVVDFERVYLLFCIDCMICGRRGGGYLIFVALRKRTTAEFSDITLYLRDRSHVFGM